MNTLGWLGANRFKNMLYKRGIFGHFVWLYDYIIEDAVVHYLLREADKLIPNHLIVYLCMHVSNLVWVVPKIYDLE